jgi:hypothetical protein
MPRQKQITTTRQHGTASKAEVFEELIKKVLGVSVRLEAKEIDKKKDSKKGGRDENL